MAGYVFPRHVVRAIEPLPHDADQWLHHPSHIESFISYREPKRHCRVAHLPTSPLSVEHFKRHMAQAKVEGHFTPYAIDWVKIQKRLLHEPDRHLSNSNVRLFYRFQQHTFLVKYGFTFGHWYVDPGTQHVFQMGRAPMICYHLPNDTSKVRANFEAKNQHAYDLYVFRPGHVYTLPENTHYLVMAVQKTLFSVHVLPLDPSSATPPQALLFTSHRTYGQAKYAIPPPTPRRPEMVMPETRRITVKRPTAWNGYKIPKKMPRTAPEERIAAAVENTMAAVLEESTMAATPVENTIDFLEENTMAAEEESTMAAPSIITLGMPSWEPTTTQEIVQQPACSDVQPATSELDPFFGVEQVPQQTFLNIPTLFSNAVDEWIWEYQHSLHPDPKIVELNELVRELEGIQIQAAHRQELTHRPLYTPINTTPNQVMDLCVK